MAAISLVRILGLLNQLRVHDRWTREQLERYQQRRLEALRAFAYHHSPCRVSILPSGAGWQMPTDWVCADYRAAAT